MAKANKIFLLIVFISLIMSITFMSIPKNAYAGTSIVNGGFEYGDFTGWNVTIPAGGTAQVVTQYSTMSTVYTAKEGRYFALLKAGSHNSYTTVSQTFAANGGTVISGWAFFKAEDYLPFNDESKVEISIVNLSEGAVLATMFFASVSTVGDYGSTPWTFWSYTLPYGGQFSVQARVINAVDDSLSSAIGLDGISLSQPSKKPFTETDSSSAMPTQSWSTGAYTKVLTASVQPSQVIAGQPVKIMANVSNRGDQEGNFTAKLSINGQLEDSKQLIIPGNSGRPIEFTVIKDKPGTYTVDINGQKIYFTVVGSSSGTSGKAIAYTIIGVIGALTMLIGISLILRRRFSR